MSKELVEFKNNKIENISIEQEFIENIAEEFVWLENFTSKATQKTYKSTVKKFCAMFEIKSLEHLRSINSMHIIKFRDAMKENGEKNSSINNRLAGLSSLFKHLIEKQIIKVNPVYGVKAMQKNYRKVSSRALNNQEVQAILNQPNTETLLGLRDKAILSILFNVGSRVGTISNLKIRDIYEEDGYMILDMHLKGDKRNKIAVNSHIQANVRNYFIRLGYFDENNKLKPEINLNFPVFPRMSKYNPKLNDLTKPISTKSIWQLWNKYVLKAGIERTRPHCARSTFITEAFKAGGDLQHIQKTAGHSDPRTTESYNHNATEHKNSASFKVSFG